MFEQRKTEALERIARALDRLLEIVESDYKARDTRTQEFNALAVAAFAEIQKARAAIEKPMVIGVVPEEGPSTS